MMPQKPTPCRYEMKAVIKLFERRAALRIVLILNLCYVSSVADRRSSTGFQGGGMYLVSPFDAATGTGIGRSTTRQGAFDVTDPHSAMINRAAGDAYLTGGHSAVPLWDSTSGAVSASAVYDNGRWPVADTLIDTLPAMKEKKWSGSNGSWTVLSDAGVGRAAKLGRTRGA